MPHKLALATLAALTLASGQAEAATLKIIYQASAAIEGPGQGTLLAVLPVSGGAIVEELTTTGQAIILLSQPGKGKPWIRTVIKDIPSSDACGTGVYGLTGHLVANGKTVWGMTGNTCGSAGSLFKLSPPASKGASWTYRSVFLMPASYGSGKVGAGFDNFAFDAGGNLYGMLVKGGYGSGCDSDGCARIFEVTAGNLASGTPTVETLYTLPTTAAYPGGLVRDRQGHLFTTTYEGGSTGYGSVWEFTKGKTGWQGQDIQDFCILETCTAGFGPVNSLSVDASGDLYGTSKYDGVTAHSGAVCYQSGQGVFWKMSPPTAKGGAWSIAPLYTLWPDTFTGYPCGQPTFDSGIAGPETPTILTHTGLMLSAMDTAHATGGGIVSLNLTTLTDAIYAPFGNDSGPGETAGPEHLRGPLVQDSAGNVWGVSNTYIDPTSPSGNAPPVVFEITP